ncbi:MAG TPA: hypothetical protein VL992_05735 [Tepidisphaeraceae bacterium]|nr:hypothetical protein [Tepidisphaeraceae bacterium]
MSLSISLPADVEEVLRDRAAAAGKDVETFAREAVEEKLRQPKTYREIFAPLQEAFAEAKIDDRGLADLFSDLRDKVWSQRRNDGPESHP